MKITINSAVSLAALFAMCMACNDNDMAKPANQEAKETSNFYGYNSKAEWGEHLVKVGGCGDCHTPKKMTEKGPVQDSSLLLSGHPANMPPPPVSITEATAKGLAVTQTLTSWVGPWGVSFAGNITSDSTGIGMWSEKQFSLAIRGGKFKGLENNRPIMPPMPIEAFVHFTDDEVSAIFAYLKTVPPIKNVVPAWQPPGQ